MSDIVDGEVRFREHGSQLRFAYVFVPYEHYRSGRAALLMIL